MDDQSNRIQNSHILETDHTENQQPERISTAREITSPLHDAKPSEDKVGDKAGDRPIISSPNASNLSYSQIYTTKQSDADSSVNKKLEEERKLRQSTTEVPDMLSWPFIGLYCQYAAVGPLESHGKLISNVLTSIWYRRSVIWLRKHRSSVMFLQFRWTAQFVRQLHRDRQLRMEFEAVLRWYVSIIDHVSL